MIDGEMVGSIETVSPWDILVTALREAVAEARALGIPLDAAHWIATGALTGIRPVACEQNAIVQFEGYESIEMVMSDIRNWQNAWCKACKAML